MSTTVTHKFYVVDLVRNKPKTRLIQIPNYRVDVEMKITTKKKGVIPKTKLKRLEEVGIEKLEAIENDIRQLAIKGEKEAVSLMGVPGKKSIKAVDEKIKEVNASIARKIEGAQKAAEKAIEAEIKKEKKNDSLLFEAKVAFVWRLSKIGISIATAVTKLFASQGSDLSSYYTIAKDVYKLYGELKKLMETDEKKRKLLTDALDLHRKGKCGTDILEKARANYRNHTTKTRQKADAISAKGELLAKKAGAQKTFKDSIKVAAKAMQIKREASKLAKLFEIRQAFLDKMQQEIVAAGGTYEDRTTWDKLTSLDTKTIIDRAKDVGGFVNSVYDLAKEIHDVAA